MTTATPFVSSPFGVGVVEVSGCRDLIQAFVRFQDGSRRWVPVGDCELSAPRPDWYSEPDPSELPGYVR